MKVGIITFHASHNYGSMLQAYALQQTVISLGFECHIINLRLPIQKKIYRPFHRQEGWMKKLKAVRYPLLAVNDIRKHSLFERFICQKYILSPETYTSADELKAAQLDYDCYISGSDQIWNTSCDDFSTSYYLDFVKEGCRIAYAPSMGPMPDMVNDKFTEFILDCLSKYNYISVREPGTAKRIKQITGKDAIITCDPTLLLSQSEWSSIAGERPLINGDYILLYAPWYFNYPELYEEAAKLAEKEGMRVICTLPEAYRYWSHKPHFKYYTAVGPVEFLNYIKYSRAVMCGSFHAVVFSLVFNKPFYSYKGMDDSRISHLLGLTGLKKCASLPNNICDIEYTGAYNKLLPFIESSRNFLIESLK